MNADKIKSNTGTKRMKRIYVVFFEPANINRIRLVNLAVFLGVS